MLQFHLRQTLLVSAFALLSVPAFAGDGATLIDQNAALSGNVTAGDEAGFPIDLTQPGSYRLSSNLVVPDLNTTAIRISADDVTLDLNGFQILGPNVCHADEPTICDAAGAGMGVISDSFSPVAPRGVRVLNGAVRGMGRVGIWLRGDQSRVERVNASSNGAAGIIVGLDGSVVDSAASVNGNVGIVGATVLHSSSEKNVDTGIVVRFDGVAIGNRANGNGGNGITATAGATLTGNTANKNKGFGIEAACPGNLQGNTAITNQSGGIHTDGDCVLLNNAQ